jgi:hypothetical protein
MDQIKNYLIIVIWILFQWNSNPARAQAVSDKEVIIDERDQGMTIIQVIPIDKVWSGHSVGFALLTNRDDQYIAYYNADRHMVVGQRKLHEKEFQLSKLPVFERDEGKGTSTVLGWDSHNYVTLGVDKEGYLHLAGNMHVHPLTYFKSTSPKDISTLKQVREMVGTEEDRCTYPKFMNTKEGELIFHYRDGGSGDGSEIYNIYSCQTGEWSRLLDSPLTDGLAQMNAYASQPSVREDGWYHMYWVWRDTPDCSTNHDLSYIKSPNMKDWYNAFGQPVKLPVTPEEHTVIVDPIPVNGGIINLAAKLCLDEKQNPVMAYHKYDENGNLQFYVAKAVSGKWGIRSVTNWDYRWYFSGNGSINNEVRLGNFTRRKDGRYELDYQHIKYGTGTILLDKDLNPIGKILKPEPLILQQEPEGEFPNLQVRIASDLGTGNSQTSYVLKWESLPANRDRPYPKPWPEPSQLYLYEIKND